MIKFLLVLFATLCVLFVYILGNTNFDLIHKGNYINVDDLSVELPALINNRDKILTSSILYKSLLHSKHNLLNDAQFIIINEEKQRQDIFNILGQDSRWLILPNDFKSSAIYRLFDDYHGKNLFMEYYELKFEGENASIYKRKKNKNKAVLIYRDKFILQDREYIIRGINAYNLAYEKLTDIEKTFADLNNVGVNTIRFWAFEKDISGFRSEKERVEATQEHWKRLDLVLFLADKYNIKVIPVLMNNWDDFGGKKYYLRQSHLDTKNKDLFFSEEEPKRLFKKHISKTLHRKNTFTGVYYKDDSNILAWELMNEPRIAIGKRKILRNWVEDVAQYIKNLDNEHPIYIGNELETGINEDTRKPIDLCAIENIDICSLHLYLYNGKKLAYNNLDEIADLFAEHRKFASQHNKPIVLGGFGISEKDRPYGQSPVEVLKFIAQQALKTNINGYLIWDWDPLYYYDPLSFTTDKKRIYSIEKLQEIIKTGDIK